MFKHITRITGLALLSAALPLAVQASTERPDLKDDCDASLATADARLSSARAEGASEGVAVAEAATLIAAAKVQRTFSEYENCHLKAKRAIKVLVPTQN